uniref:(northern house mosquito) hypothetical protein n=1 Tax=Culex pipiens TaxID=7175 RepID=A0A8D7ZT21_CULPI
MRAPPPPQSQHFPCALTKSKARSRHRLLFIGATFGPKTARHSKFKKGLVCREGIELLYCMEFGARLFPFGEMVREEGRRKSPVRVCKQLWSLTFWPTLGKGTFGNYAHCSRSGLW